MQVKGQRRDGWCGRLWGYSSEDMGNEGLDLHAKTQGDLQFACLQINIAVGPKCKL